MTHDIPGTALLGALAQPAFLFGPDERIAAANEKALALAGRPLEGLTPPSVAALFRVRRRDGVLGGDAGLPIARVLAGEEVAELRLTITAADGRTLSILSLTSPVRDGAHVVGALVVWHEATPEAQEQAALAESEAQYRALVERSPDAILIHQDDLIVFANPAAVGLIGAGATETLVGLSVADLVHPAARAEVEGNIASDLRGEESPLTTVEIVRRDGSSAVVQGRGSLVPFRGRPAVQVVLRDVTDATRAADALRESERRRALRLMLGDRLRGLSDAGEMAAAATALLGRHLGAGEVVYLETDAAGESATVRADWNDGTVPPVSGTYPLDRQAVDEFYRGELVRDLLPFGASLEVPVCQGERLAAILAVRSAAPRTWTPAEIGLVQHVGDRTWAAVRRAQSEAAHRESEVRLQLALESAELGM